MTHFDPSDPACFPGVTAETKKENYNRFWGAESLGEKIQMMWAWGIINDMFEQHVWWKDERLLATSNEKAWEVKERARIEREISDRKRHEEEQAKAARQQEERSALLKRLEEVRTAGDAAREVEVRLQIARLDRASGAPATQAATPPPGYAVSTPLPQAREFAGRSTSPSIAPAATGPRGHGRLAYLGYNILIVLPIILLIQLHPILALLTIPAHFWNVQKRLQNIGWDSSFGMTSFWVVGMLVPVVNLILGLIFLFTPPENA
jgi:hypothetical protein